MEPAIVNSPAEYDWRRDRRLAACLIATGLLLIGTFRDNGEGYYTFLRIYVCAAAAVVAISDWRAGRVWLPLSAALVAILFNPVRPIEMDRQAWEPYDLAAAAWFAAVGLWPLLRRWNRRTVRYAALALGALAVAGVAAELGSGSNENANNTMDIDENLTTTDMNATDVNAADMNATDMNVTAANPYAGYAAEMGAAGGLNEFSNSVAENAADQALNQGSSESEEANLAATRNLLRVDVPQSTPPSEDENAPEVNEQ